ncbi:MAG: hypothetical protein QOJ88_1460 [Pyrinomonadaceae bacterium]|jgi:hypothetical protein|nr:hypothetical protein [Pyrinomonadaceae bacterium]MDQ1728168.1 hypothetical protein [Pyrinomonadaceae bacterium]
MSKKTRRLPALFAILTLILTAFPTGYLAQRANVAGSAARGAAIAAATSEVLKETSAIRELAILRPVKSGAQTRLEIEGMLVKQLDEQTSAAQMHGTEVGLRKFGLAPANFEYRPFIIKLLTEQVAGYYDPKLQMFHLADWLELEGQKPVMAHELTHALQDQHFNLRRFEKWPHGDSDAELAAHALIEGDATLAMTIYMAKNPLVALAFSRSLTTGVATEQFNQAPRALRESLIFPYLQGMEWTTQLYKRGGWSLVSKAFTQLPASTEQILHPEKYFNDERPVQVILPDLTALLTNPAAVTQSPAATAGALPAPVRTKPTRRIIAKLHVPAVPSPNAPWRRIDSDVNGEWNYYLVLDQFLNSAAESKRAAAGWAGDRYALYEGPNGQVLLAQVAVWDTENDAREFFDAYVKRTELRYPGATRLNSGAKPETRNSKLQTASSYSWETSEGRVAIELRGSRVVILEGVPEKVDVETLTAALGQ